MAFEVSVHETAGVVVVTVDGTLTADDIREGLVAVWKTPEFHENARVLWDLRDANAAELPTSALRDIARFESQERPDIPPARLAFLTAREVEFGLARMIGAFSDDAQIQQSVFRDYEEAWRWLTD